MHTALVTVLYLFLSRCDKIMQMQHNAAALALSKTENFHLKNIAAGFFLWHLIQGPAEICHCTAKGLQNL